MFKPRGRIPGSVRRVLRREERAKRVTRGKSTARKGDI